MRELVPIVYEYACIVCVYVVMKKNAIVVCRKWCNEMKFVLETEGYFES